MKITTQKGSQAEITHAFEEASDEPEFKGRHSISAEVRLNNRGCAVEFKKPDGTVVGQAAFDIWTDELRVYTWTDRQLANDGAVHVLYSLEQLKLGPSEPSSLEHTSVSEQGETDLGTPTSRFCPTYRRD